MRSSERQREGARCSEGEREGVRGSEREREGRRQHSGKGECLRAVPKPKPSRLHAATSALLVHAHHPHAGATPSSLVPTWQQSGFLPHR